MKILMVEQASILTLMVLVVSIAYQAGQHSQRISSLERWRSEFITGLDNRLHYLEVKLDAIRNLITEGNDN